MLTLQSHVTGIVPAVTLNYKYGDKVWGVSIAEKDFEKPELIVAALRNLADFVEASVVAEFS